MKSKRPEVFNKYYYYENSVQCPEVDIKFFNEKYKEIQKRKPYIFREDFCGTGFLSSEWVKQSPRHKAIGIDLDLEPLTYGKNNHMAQLTPQQQERLIYLNKDVLAPGNPKADIVAALNFSYFIFKSRKQLLGYFKAIYKTLDSKGVFFLDLFGGPESMTLLEEETEHKDFSYYWDCDYFNPISHECTFYIHFKVKGEKRKRRKVFTYNWRMWTIPELKDLLAEAGFKKVYTYWEGDDDDGGGNGEFHKTQEGENCESWVAYLGAVK